MENSQSIPDQLKEYLPSNTNKDSVKSWLGTLALLLIPIVNMILLFVWAFGEDSNVSKKNFAKVQLILMVIIFGLYLLVFVFFLALVGISASF